MRLSLPILLIATAVAFGSAARAAPAESAPPQVLLVVSGHGQDSGKTRPGFEMDELAQAYSIFTDNGFAVSIASPQGGKVEADKYDAGKPYNARLLADPKAMGMLVDTRALSSVRAGDYAAVFVVGGKGAMFDLPGNADLQALLARTFDSDGVVAAVCHGPAALIDVRLGNGEPLIARRAVTGFSNEEETLFGARWIAQYSFLLEDAMRKRGGRFSEAHIMLPHVEIDGRLITGQNPFSTPRAAEAVVRALGRTPVARTPWADENSMMLVARFLDGDEAWAAQELSVRAAGYDLALIGLYGVVRARAAGTDREQLASGLALMQLASAHVAQPRLQLAMADAELKLGNRAAARHRIEKLLEAAPDLAEARTMLETINQ